MMMPDHDAVQLHEMSVWKGLSMPSQEFTTKRATKLVAWARRHAAETCRGDPPFVRRGDTLRPTIERENVHILSALDRAILSHLNVMKGNGIALPLIPLMVAVWTQIMGFVRPSGEEETSYLLVMHRVRSTAELAAFFNTSKDEAARAELVERGLLSLRRKK